MIIKNSTLRQTGLEGPWKHHPSQKVIIQKRALMSELLRQEVPATISKAPRQSKVTTKEQTGTKWIGLDETLETLLDQANRGVGNLGLPEE